MRFQSVPQLSLLALGVIVSLAMGVSNVASNDFASLNVRPISATDDMVAMNCQDSSEQPWEMNMSCAVICVGLVMALAPAAASLQRGRSALDFATLLAKFLVDSSPPPEFPPPRTAYIA
ncbi:MAG: hypothetical protein KME20_28400 [Kaiparowitsia implicata GSE-PSE-MK54-09C]|jgi:hypothetical protein|nr:hypothetical protein [Kaiparowitsia implicata GSE-PSE-MK54-09C]